MAGSASVAAGATGSQQSKPSGCSDEAVKTVNAHRGEPPFSLPSGPSTMAKNKGKTIWLVTSNSAPIVHDVGDNFVKAVSAAGMTGKVWYSTGTADDQARGVAQAVGQKADGIVLMGNPQVLKNSIAEAAKANIPMAFFSQDSSVELPASIQGSVPADWEADGRLAANWILQDSNCDAEVAIVEVPTLTSSARESAGVQAVIKDSCPKCKVHVVQVAVANIATEVPQSVRTLLLANPGVNYIVTSYDSFVTPVSTAVTQASAKVKLVGHDGDKANLELIRNGKQAFDLALPPAGYIAARIVNEIGEAMGGGSPARTALPGRVIDSTNVGSGDAFPSYSNAIDKFATYWNS